MYKDVVNITVKDFKVPKINYKVYVTLDFTFEEFCTKEEYFEGELKEHTYIFVQPVYTKDVKDVPDFKLFQEKFGKGSLGDRITQSMYLPHHIEDVLEIVKQSYEQPTEFGKGCDVELIVVGGRYEY